MSVLTINLVLSTLVFWVAAKIYLLSRPHELRPPTVLLRVFLLHSFRRLGLMFLASGATYAGIPPQFAYPAALGATWLRLYSPLYEFQLSRMVIGVAGFSSGPSTWKDHWI